MQDVVPKTGLYIVLLTTKVAPKSNCLHHKNIFDYTKCLSFSERYLNNYLLFAQGVVHFLKLNSENSVLKINVPLGILNHWLNFSFWCCR